MSTRQSVRMADVTDEASWALLPLCADPRFDHRSCDYWEDPVHGLKSARTSWWQASPASLTREAPRSRADNPFAPAPGADPTFNPFLATPPPDPDFNPFLAAPPPDSRPGPDMPRKLRLLTRGLVVFGSYAKVLVVDGSPVAYAQFGPLSAYPRAQQIRDLYPALPSTPLPAVITCVATSAAARGKGLGVQLVAAVTDDLATRGFAAVEAYPDLTLSEDEASTAHPRFWERCGFHMAIADERYPVMRAELH